MIIVLKSDIRPEEKTEILRRLRQDGAMTRESPDRGKWIIGVVGRKKPDPKKWEGMPGVEKIVPVTTAFKLVSRQMQPEDTHVDVGGGIIVGGERIAVIAGPCAVESMEQVMTIARQVRRYGATLFRGGAYKPRTSPYSFQGMEEDGLKLLAQVREEFGFPVVTEITSPSHADVMMKYVDVVQVGARNMQNFELLKCVGRMGKPVLLKRGLSATIEEWLMSAEYILSEGNDKVILCERGIRTFEPYTRNTLDLSAIPVIKQLTHLPVVIDPSHATGMREKVSPMARAAVAAGADGLMIEVHHDPDNAFSDGPQSLYPEQFGRLMRDLYVIAPVVGRQIDFDYVEKMSAIKSEKKNGESPIHKTAFLGEIGTYSHRALRQYFGETHTPVPKASFRRIFEAVKQGETEFGVVPLENSLTGSIHEVYDLLLEENLFITGEITLRIKHHLIGNIGADMDGIKRIFGPPQALGQCRQFIERNGWEAVSVEDTVSGVRKIKAEGNLSDVAIAGKETAEIYEMEVLAEGIETNPGNFTRFVVIGRERIRKTPRKKSSLIFSIGNQPGALFETLKIFADNGINLVKLESRPIHGKPWEYMFYTDFEADAEAEEFRPILSALEKNSEYLKVLGSY